MFFRLEKKIDKHGNNALTESTLGTIHVSRNQFRGFLDPTSPHVGEHGQLTAPPPLHDYVIYGWRAVSNVMSITSILFCLRGMILDILKHIWWCNVVDMYKYIQDIHICRKM